MPSSRIRGLVRAFQGRHPSTTNVPNDSSTHTLQAFREELVDSAGEGDQPVMVSCEDESDSHNDPFSEVEFEAAIAETRVKSAPSLDLISNKVIKELPSFVDVI